MTTATTLSADPRGGAEPSAPPRRYWLVKLWVAVLVAYVGVRAITAVLEPMPLWLLQLAWVSEGVAFASTLGLGVAMVTVALVNEVLFPSRLVRWLGLAQLALLVLGLLAPLVGGLSNALNAPEPVFTTTADGHHSMAQSGLTIYGPSPLTLFGLLIFIGLTTHVAVRLWNMRRTVSSQGLDG